MLIGLYGFIFIFKSLSRRWIEEIWVAARYVCIWTPSYIFSKQLKHFEYHWPHNNSYFVTWRFFTNSPRSGSDTPTAISYILSPAEHYMVHTCRFTLMIFETRAVIVLLEDELTAAHVACYIISRRRPRISDAPRVWSRYASMSSARKPRDDILASLRLYWTSPSQAGRKAFLNSAISGLKIIYLQAHNLNNEVAHWRFHSRHHIPQLGV